MGVLPETKQRATNHIVLMNLTFTFTLPLHALTPASVLKLDLVHWRRCSNLASGSIPSKTMPVDMHRKLPGECNAGIISLSEKMDFHNIYQTTTQLLTHAKSLITGNCRIPFSIFPPFIHLHQPEVATSIYP